MRATRALTALAFLAGTLSAQSRTYTQADYERARQFLAPALASTVVGGTVNANWVGGKFWYRNTTLAGPEIVVINVVTKARVRCESTVTECDGLPITAGNGRGGRGGGGRAGGGGGGRGASNGPPLSLSPDGKKGVFIQRLEPLGARRRDRCRNGSSRRTA